MLVIGLGSNLGDRLKWLRFGVAAIHELSPIVAVSSLFETDPQGGPAGQSQYLNAAARVEDGGSLLDWLGRLQRLETLAGREPGERWGPRTLDLDLLWSSGPSLQSRVLTVPHPALTQRLFALLPLLDVAPNAREPQSQRAYSELSTALPSQGVCRVAPAVGWCPGFPSESSELRLI